MTISPKKFTALLKIESIGLAERLNRIGSILIAIGTTSHQPLQQQSLDLSDQSDNNQRTIFIFTVHPISVGGRRSAVAWCVS